MVDVFYFTKKRALTDSPMSVVVAFLIFLFLIIYTSIRITYPGPGILIQIPLNIQMQT